VYPPVDTRLPAARERLLELCSKVSDRLCLVEVRDECFLEVLYVLDAGHLWYARVHHHHEESHEETTTPSQREKRTLTEFTKPAQVDNNNNNLTFIMPFITCYANSKEQVIAKRVTSILWHVAEAFPLARQGTIINSH